MKWCPYSCWSEQTLNAWITRMSLYTLPSQGQTHLYFFLPFGEEKILNNISGLSKTMLIVWSRKVRRKLEFLKAKLLSLQSPFFLSSLLINLSDHVITIPVYSPLWLSCVTLFTAETHRTLLTADKWVHIYSLTEVWEHTKPLSTYLLL